MGAVEWRIPANKSEGLPQFHAARLATGEKPQAAQDTDLPWWATTTTTPDPDAVEPRPDTPAQSRWTSLGCFRNGVAQDIEQLTGVIPANSEAPLSLEGAAEVPRDPVNCTVVCSDNGYSIAAMRGESCFCLTNRSSLDAVNVGSCGLKCTSTYFSSTAKFCGGLGQHYSVYQEYDFSHPTAQGCYDPFRYIWYQSVAVEEQTLSKTTGDLQPGFQWYLHASSTVSGEPMFPYQQQLNSMLFGLQYDLDGSRIMGYMVPYWNGKTTDDIFYPTMKIWEMNSMQESNIRFWTQSFTLMREGEADMLSTGVTALDSIYDLYYMTVPGIMSDDGNHFLTRIYVLELDKEGRLLQFIDTDQQVAVLEVNDNTHEVFAVLHVAGDTPTSGAGHFYVKLGEATMYIKWPENPFEKIETTIDFHWTFSGGIREATVDKDVFFALDNYTEKYFQVGATAIDVLANTSFFVYKDRPDADAPYLIKDVNFGINESIPETKVRNVEDFKPIPGPEVNALWIYNMHPITTWFSPEILYVRFHMDGHIVYVRFENQTLGGITPFDVNGDTLPDDVDWAEFRAGRRNCSEMFAAFEIENRLKYMPYTQCEFQDNHTIVIRLNENVTTLNPGELITLKNDTIFSFYPELDCWSFSAFGTFRIGIPDPLYPPVPQVFSLTGGSAGMDFSVYPKDEVPLCYTSGIDATNSYYHGGVPLYTWTLLAVSCVYTDSFGYTTGFFPNNTMSEIVRSMLADSSAGSTSHPHGSSRVDFQIMDLEPGCTFRMRLLILGRWGLTSTTSFDLVKMPPPPVLGWKPSCSYICNAATCEPPSQCVDGQCVCAKDRFGMFCTGICPMCSPYKSFGCNDGTNGTGTCICRVGWVGDYCDQKVEWTATDWSPCLPCGAAVGTQSRILKCVNVVTQQVVDDNNCKDSMGAAVQNCKPPLCPCSAPPNVTNANNAAIAEACPTTLSGGSCPVICLPGFIAVGEFRCYAGGFIERPRCMPGGAAMVTLPGVSMRLRIGGISTTLSPDEYLEQIGTALKTSLAKLLSASSPYTISPDYIQLIIVPLEGDVIIGGGRRLRSNNSPEDQATTAAEIDLLGLNNSRVGNVTIGAEIRRLTVNNYELIVTIAFPNQDSLDQGETLLSSFESDPSALRDSFKAEYLSSCNVTQTCVPLPPDDFWEADSPARTQVYSVQTAAVIVTTTPPDPLNGSGVAAQQSSSSKEETGSTDFVVGIVLGITIGIITMCCCGVGIFVLVTIKLRKVAEVIPESQGPEMVDQEEVDRQEGIPKRDSTQEPAENTRILNPLGRPVSGRVRREWAGGGMYDGCVWEGLREGEGRMEWPNGKIYAGQWMRGKPHGHGVLTAPGEKGWVYNGQFKNGLRDGNGRCESVSRGIWYEGEWSRGLQQGTGESGALPRPPGDARFRPLAAPPTAHLWIMENGEQHEHLALSPVAPDASSLIRFSLEATQEDLDRIEGPDFNPGGVSGPSVSEVQDVARLWGIAFGVPDVWLPGQCGALIITRILDDGALARWNMWQHRDFGNSAESVLPNALIWKVNDMEADVPRMADEMKNEAGRRSIRLTICNPASSRFPRRPRSGLRLPPMPGGARGPGGRGSMQPPRPPDGVRSASDPNQEVVDLRSSGRTQMPSTLGLLNLPPPPPLLPPRPPLGRDGSPSRSEDDHTISVPPLPKASAFSYRRAADIQRNNALAQSVQQEGNARGLRSVARTGMSSPRPPELPG